ncbi:MAG TPA: deoxyribodipyrimidine photo-lyase [Phycisphaerae bacterium]|nr:deoxyribodipyrimidine photo-lyase [Phycisphaerae bacterium]
MRALVWFRSDLRVDDNTALSAACAAADRGIAGVFLLSPRQWRRHDWADIKVEFLLRNLACLAERLKRWRIPLLVREAATFADVPDVLLALANRLQCDALYFNREYEVNEQRRDAAVAKTFEREGIAVRSFHDQTIVPPDALRTSTGRFYTMFAPFKRAWIACVREREPAPVPAPRPQPALVCAPDSIPESVAGFDLSKGSLEEWPAGERYAAARLSTFVDRRLASYKQLRDFPGSEATSRLSPYLAIGVISPRRCLAEARQANRGRLNDGRAGPATWISELVWREFYRHVLIGYPRVSMNRAFKPATERLPWRHDEEPFQAWCEGRTGFPIVDAGMRQLFRTGWMHNRLRMIVAMFLSKDLFIDWRRGEQHFMRHLVDGDLANNNGGWQWSASTGTDAVPYFRVFNPWLQSRKCDPDGEFIRRWVPELRCVDPRVLHHPPLLARERRAGLAYAQPICDHEAARQRVIEAFRNLPEVRARHH